MARLEIVIHFAINSSFAQDADARYQTIDEVCSAFEQLIKGIEEPKPPRETAAEIIEHWMNLPIGEDLEALRALHEHLERNGDDGPMLRAVVPRIPEGMLVDYVNELPTEFRRALELYDGHVSGSLDFEYCDDLDCFGTDWTFQHATPSIASSPASV